MCKLRATGLDILLYCRANKHCKVRIGLSLRRCFVLRDRITVPTCEPSCVCIVRSWCRVGRNTGRRHVLDAILDHHTARLASFLSRLRLLLQQDHTLRHPRIELARVVHDKRLDGTRHRFARLRQGVENGLTTGLVD